MQLFFTDVKKVRRSGVVAQLSAAELSGPLAQYGPVAGTPIVLSESMRPVEPLCGWLRELALKRRSTKTMRAYAYTAVMLLRFLHARRLDLASAADTDLQDFHPWRLDGADENRGRGGVGP